MKDLMYFSVHGSTLTQPNFEFRKTLTSACYPEVVEGDFSKLLAEGNAAEAMAVEEYEKLTQDNAIATTEKETAVKYKTKDSKETEAMLAGIANFRSKIAFFIYEDVIIRTEMHALP